MVTHHVFRLLITPLSPVHVGTGESYEPTNYVIEDGVLHEFDTGTAMQVLSISDRQRLLEISNAKPNQDMLKALQHFFYERRDGLMAHAVQRIPVLAGVARFYASRIGQSSNFQGGVTSLNLLGIDRTSFNPISRLPVLFGSSIKGAVRTALLNQRNEGRRAPEHKGLHEFQGRLFKYRDSVRGRLSLHQDPMRLIQLADAAWSGEPGLPPAQVHLAVNRKKAPVVDDKGQLRSSMAEELYQILECVPPWHYRAFRGELGVQSLAGLDNRYQEHLPARELRFDLQGIAQACNAFYGPIFEGENKRLRERGYLDEGWDRSIQRLLDAATAKRLANQAFLLRIGRHSGAESVTVEGVRNIKIMKGKGQTAEYMDAAKTFWLAADTKDQQTGLLPFGWVLVEAQPLDQEPSEWPELQQVCTPHQSAGRAFARKISDQEAKFAQARLEVITRRLAEEEQARNAMLQEIKRQAEEEAKCRAEQEAELRALEELKQARIAAVREAARVQAEFDALSENQKKVLGIRERGTAFAELSEFAKSQKKGDLDRLIKELMALAPAWPDAADRNDLANALEYVFGKIGWYDEGLKKDKRVKQEKNRRDGIEKIRRGAAPEV